MSKATICLWFNHDSEEAARFYAATFPHSRVGAVHRAPSDYPGGSEGPRWWSSSPSRAGQPVRGGSPTASPSR